MAVKKDHSRRSSSRRGRNQAASFTVDQLRDELGKELIEVCMSALTRFKVKTPKYLAGSRHRCGLKAILAHQVVADAEQISGMFTHWREQSDYLETDTTPRVISIMGPAPSFSALCSTWNTRRNMSRLLSLAVNLGMCKRLDKGRLALLSNVALYAKNPTLMLAYTIQNMERFVRTAVLNKVRGRGDGLVQRTAFGYLSNEDFPAFAQMVRHLVSSLTEQQDRWMIGHGGATKGKPGKRLCGLTAFVFRD